MKKIFTLIAMAVMAMGVQAQTEISFAGLTMSDFSFTEGEYAATEVDGGVSINYVKGGNTWCTLKVKDIPFRYKNSSTKEKFFVSNPDFFTVAGKGVEMQLANAKLGQIITLNVAKKDDPDSKGTRQPGFAATGAKLDSNGIDDSTAKEIFADVVFTATTNGTVTIKNNDNAYLIKSIKIVDGDAPEMNGVIDFPTFKTGISFIENSSVTFEDVKINKNANPIPSIKFAGGYTTEGVLNNNYAKIQTEGGFKAGDIITIAGVYSNADTKVALIDIFTYAEETIDKLFTSQEFINGRTSEAAPADEVFVLTADASELYIGRSSTAKTATYITKLNIKRGDITLIHTVKPAQTHNGIVYNLAGQKVNNSFKGIVVKDGKKIMK
jgi:hypothetical protein